MNHFINDTLPLILFGLSGILIMVLVKINDLNHKPETDGKSFSQVMSLFFKKEWASYCASLVIVLLTSFSHDEWLKWFEDGGKLASVAYVPIGVKLGMAGFGMLGHYFLYKFVLGKLDK